METIDVEIVSTNRNIPSYQTSGSSGVDLYAACDECIVLQAGKTILIPTGYKMKIPKGYEGQIRSRSGLALKKGIIVLNSPGTIDSDYRGEIKIILHNISNTICTIEPRARIAQMVFTPYVKAKFNIVDNLSSDDHNDRGCGGFGSTGIGDLKIE